MGGKDIYQENLTGARKGQDGALALGADCLC